MQETPLLAEVLSEGIGNVASIARLIKKDVERRALEAVSEQAIAMALHRLPSVKKHPHVGFKFLKDIQDISLRSDLVLVFVHSGEKVVSKLTAFEERHPNAVIGITKGLAETMVVLRGEGWKVLAKSFGPSLVRVQEHLAAITMRLPSESMSVPGVYYPILKVLAWEGINVVELVSAGTELSLFVEDKDIDRALRSIRSLVGKN